MLSYIEIQPNPFSPRLTTNLKDARDALEPPEALFVPPAQSKPDNREPPQPNIVPLHEAK